MNQTYADNSFQSLSTLCQFKKFRHEVGIWCSNRQPNSIWSGQDIHRRGSQEKSCFESHILIKIRLQAAVFTTVVYSGFILLGFRNNCSQIFGCLSLAKQSSLTVCLHSSSSYHMARTRARKMELASLPSWWQPIDPKWPDCSLMMAPTHALLSLAGQANSLRCPKG